jgi:Protein of unknown function (DUF3102)
MKNELSTLSVLAAEINSARDTFKKSTRRAIEEGYYVGELLARAKGQLAHGEWLPWVEANCTFAVREAQRYLRAYEKRAQLPNASGMTHLSLTAAMKALEAPRVPEPKTRTLDELGPESRKELCRDWPDVALKNIVLLDAARWDVERIAAYLGLPIERVECVLDPIPPERFVDNDGGAMLEGLDDDEQLRRKSAYFETVISAVESILATSCENASVMCDDDGYPELGPILRDRARQHKRRKDAALARGGVSYREALTSEDVPYWFAFHECAADDARSALGLCDPAPNLDASFQELHDAMTAQQAA